MVRDNIVKKNENVGEGNKTEIVDSTKDLWSKCLKIISDNVSKQVFKTWFLPMRAVSFENSLLSLSVPSQFFFEWIEEHYYDLMNTTISAVFGDKTKVQYQIVFDDYQDEHKQVSIKLPGLKNSGKPVQHALPFEPIKITDNDFPSFLNPRYTFDGFITGECNQLASSAAKAVSQNPGKTRFNPLVIYGETGLGKTHLAQAIGNNILNNYPRQRVLYTSSEKFINDFINSIQNNKINEFLNFYRSIDVLIVDDIQFLAGKKSTQDNFFHTFNSLYQSGKQIVLTSDKAPSELKDVDERLISRFKWGLTTDVTIPDYEMRVAILQKKSYDEGIEIPPDIIQFIARNIKGNIRELEGILISIIAKVTLDKKPLSMEIAKEVIFGTYSVKPKEITIELIKRVVSEYYQVQVDLLESKSRKHEITLARQMAIYFTKLLTNMSLKTIGSNFGNRDHSTVLHSCQAIENYIETDKRVKNSYDIILQKLKGF